jgi:uroporphyrinogen decarboxylase
MRQAGRYLPEYRETRAKAGSFLELCFTPELAAEVTLQPVRRFDFDVAILFSDILVVPHALGQRVTFEDGRGPVLGPLPQDLDALDPSRTSKALTPILVTVKLVRQQLDAGKALIGFCGAPWTVATYMVAGGGNTDLVAARRMALEDPTRFQALIDILVEASVHYLIGQIDAGVDVVKIFDSWAGVLDEQGFARWAIAPVRKIVERVRAAHPGIPVIGFPRGAGTRIGRFVEETGVDAVAVDGSLPMMDARKLVPEGTPLQGNLDPLRLVVGGKALDEGIDHILQAMRGQPHIFNLGHGITPDTPVENVARLVERVRASHP